MHFRTPTILTALLLCISVNVYAQAMGRVLGRVLDQTGATLPGVAIDLVVNYCELTAVTDDTSSNSSMTGTIGHSSSKRARSSN